MVAERNALGRGEIWGLEDQQGHPHLGRCPARPDAVHAHVCSMKMYTYVPGSAGVSRCVHQQPERGSADRHTQSAYWLPCTVYLPAMSCTPAPRCRDPQQCTRTHTHAHTRILPRHSRTRALGQQCLRPGCPATCVPYMFGHMSPYVDTGLVAHTCLDTCMSSRGHDLRHLGVFVYIADCGRSHSHLCVYGFLSAQSHAWADTGLRRPAHPPPSPAPGPQALAPTPTLSPPCRGRVLQRRADAVSGPAAV